MESVGGKIVHLRTMTGSRYHVRDDGKGHREIAGENVPSPTARELTRGAWYTVVDGPHPWPPEVGKSLRVAFLVPVSESTVTLPGGFVIGQEVMALRLKTTSAVMEYTLVEPTPHTEAQEHGDETKEAE